MKLTKCYIENFGTLHNFEYNFKDGLNVILEENGFGKTTFGAFIRSMFYGLDGSRSESSDRKKYKPWQGGNFGGNIEFEIKNKRYRIERRFGNKISEDSFKLYNLDTGLESKDYSENIGEEIFKINKQGYERTTYIPQNHIKIDMEDSINAKLGNVLETGNDVDSSEKAISKLDETIKIYEKRGNKGKLNEKKEELNELTRNLENKKIDEENLNQYKEKLEEKNENLKEISEKKKESQDLLSKKIDQGRKNAKKEYYDKICINVKETDERIKDLQDFWKDNKLPTDEEINNLKNDYMKTEKLESTIKNQEFSEADEKELNSLRQSFENNFPNITEKDIDEKIKQCSEIQSLKKDYQEEKFEKEQIKQNLKQKIAKQKNKKIVGIIVLIIGIICLGLGIVINKNLVSGIGILGIIIEVILEITIKNNKEIKELKQKLEQEENDLVNQENKIKELDQEIKKVISDTTESEAEKIVELMRLKESLNKLDELNSRKIYKQGEVQKAQNEKNELDEKIKNYLSKYYGNDLSGNVLNLLENLKIGKDEFLRIKSENEKFKSEKEKYEKENNIDELKENDNLENIDEDSLKEKISNLEKEFEKINDEKSQILNNIEVLENKIDSYEYIETDIENLKEQIKNIEKRIDILKKTKQYLQEAKESFSSQYLNKMVTKFNEYLNLIDDKDLKTSINTNLGVLVDVNGTKRDIKDFSSRISRFNIYLYEI